MTLRPVSPLNIPHIAEAIFEHLSFADLYHAVLICRAWHRALNELLWTDVSTSRPVLVEEVKQLNDGFFPVYAQARIKHTHHFQTPYGRKTLIKHAHHIRAITCRDKAILSALAASGCSNLRELNYVNEQRHGHDSKVDLSTLGKLIALNPRLYAVSIENIDLDTDEEHQELQNFIHSLDGYPSITCLYLHGKVLEKEWFQGSVLAILEQRLARINGSRLTSLDIGTSSLIVPRSHRGLPTRTEATRRTFWPEQRFKDEKHIKWHPSGSLAVLESNGVLQLRTASDLMLSTLDLGLK